MGSRNSGVEMPGIFSTRHNSSSSLRILELFSAAYTKVTLFDLVLTCSICEFCLLEIKFKMKHGLDIYKE